MQTKKRIPSPWGIIDVRPNRAGLLRYRLRGRIDGRLVTTGTYESLQEAQEVALATLRGAEARTEGLTLARWVPQYVERRRRGGRHRDVDSAEQVLNQHVIGSPLADRLLRQVRPRDVRQWVAAVADKRAQRGKRRGQPLARNTVRNALRALSACLADARDAGQIDVNPCEGVPVPREAPRTEQTWHYLTSAEERALAEGEQWMPRQQWTALTLAVYTGLRQGELWGLRWEDVHLGAEPRLVVRFSFAGPTKGNAVREVPLFPPAAKALSAWRRAGGAVTLGVGLVFPSTVVRKVGAGRSMAEAAMFSPGYDAGWADAQGRRRPDGTRPVQPGYRSQLGIRPNIRFHDLRHTFAVALVSGRWGRPWRLEEIQRLMGHASRTTTERYAVLAPDGVRRAVSEAMEQWRQG